jgi:hypothetical protein
MKASPALVAEAISITNAQCDRGDAELLAELEGRLIDDGLDDEAVEAALELCRERLDNERAHIIAQIYELLETGFGGRRTVYLERRPPPPN